MTKFLWKNKTKFEDWNVAISYFKKGDSMFSFDLKSGYHHYEIFHEHVKFEGFSWDFGNGTRYFSFQVLPFGLATLPMYLLNASNRSSIIGAVEGFSLFCN